MSKIDDMIAKLCPNGVEYKSLGEVCDIGKGVQFNKKDMQTEGSYPVINGGINPSGYTEQYNENKDTITISQGGASAGFVNFIETKFWAGAHCYVLKPNEKEVRNRYVYHFVKSNEYKLQECQYGAGIPALAKSTISDLQIPIPPLEIQKEIAHILDTFTKLTAELTAELTARKKQYEFYRDMMLTFKTDVDSIPLGDLFEFKNGLSKGKEFFGRGTHFISFSDVFNHRFLHKSDIKSLVECTDEEKQKLHVGRGDVLFTRTSETAEDVGHASVMLDDIGDCVFNGFSIRATPKTDKLLPEYCAYCFDTFSFRTYVTKNCGFTTRASLTGATIAEYKLPIPSIDVQKRIVNVLDNFDAVCNDLKIGLPAEIEARKKQYEYYRDRLLAFTPPQVNNSLQNICFEDEVKLFQYVFGYVTLKLGDIATDIFRGSGITRDQVTPSGIPCVRYGEIYTTYGVHFSKCVSHTNLENIQSPKFFEHGDILFAITGENIEDIAKSTAYIGNEKCLAGGDIVVLKHKQNPKYLAYALSTTNAQKQKGKGKVKSKVVHSSVPAISELRIPIPPLDVQERIVAILDRFDTLVNDISQGIPAEIEARKKQYEFYRDKLLSFKKAV